MTLCNITTSNGITWHHMALHNIIWHHMTLCNITWHHLTSHDIVTSHDTTWHHMTLCNIAWHCDITWHCVTSHDTTWHHLTPPDITWHHLTLHGISSPLQILECVSVNLTLVYALLAYSSLKQKSFIGILVSPNYHHILCVSDYIMWLGCLDYTDSSIPYIDVWHSK